LLLSYVAADSLSQASETISFTHCVAPSGLTPHTVLNRQFGNSAATFVLECTTAVMRWLV